MSSYPVIRIIYQPKFTCCITWGTTLHNAFRPASSNILSSETSCKATSVVSSMSSPAWLANMKTGCNCQPARQPLNPISLICFRLFNLSIVQISPRNFASDMINTCISNIKNRCEVYSQLYSISNSYKPKYLDVTSSKIYNASRWNKMHT